MTLPAPTPPAGPGSDPGPVGAAIELVGVSKRFGKRPAVVDLDLRVPRGAIYGLLGHNGAGKSTAIGMMLGQVWPDAGEVRLNGSDVTRHRERALRRVGAIFESPVFYDELSGWANLNILAHYSAPTPRARIREVIEWVGLAGRDRSRVRTYSHGMRARLAIAQALLPGPELLILDEPGDGLDPEGIHDIRKTIRRLHRELGLTILLSSHLLNEVEQLCDRICVLRAGRKIFEGTLAGVQARPNGLRLRVGDFGAAGACLLRAGLIQPPAGPGRVVPVAGVGADRIVRALVEAGIPVYEVAAEETTLERFYLELMEEGRTQGTVPRST